MKESTAKHLLKHVSESYNLIAHEFSDTRHTPWDEFKYFKPYLFEGAEIVDLGCGNGRALNFLYEHYLSNNFKYIGLDNSSKLLEQALIKHPRNVFLPGDQIDIPIDDGQVDIILNIAAFHHLPSTNLRLKALGEMRRILKPEGHLIITVWNLFQKKYWLENLKAWFKWLISFGNYSPTDLFIPWKKNSGKNQGKATTMRYYHSFLPSELIKLLKLADFEIIESFSAKKGHKTSFLKAYNFCIIVKKNDQP